MMAVCILFQQHMVKHQGFLSVRLVFPVPGADCLSRAHPTHLAGVWRLIDTIVYVTGHY